MLLPGYGIEIDDEDWDRVKQHRWYMTEDGMRTNIKGKAVLLSRFIMEAKAGEVVIFGDKGNLNYCKFNLTKMTRSDFAFFKQKGKLASQLNRGVYPMKNGHFSVKFRGQHIGTFTKIEDARHAFQEAYRKHFSIVDPH